MKQLLHALALCALVLTGAGQASAQFRLPGFGEKSLLPPEQAFRLEARQSEPRAIELRYVIADGYYMYRERFKFALAGEASAVLGAADFPRGVRKTDEFFGEVETYRKELTIRIPLEHRLRGEQQLSVNVTSQGCADAGVCYTPQESRATIRLVALDAAATVPAPPPSSAAGTPALYEGALGAILTGFAALAMVLGFVLWRRARS